MNVNMKDWIQESWDGELLCISAGVFPAVDDGSYEEIQKKQAGDLEEDGDHEEEKRCSCKQVISIKIARQEEEEWLSRWL